MRDIRELQYFQSLPLAMKVQMTEQRIQGWYEYFEGKVYISFSGGKDSTVLLNIARQMYPSIEAVFVDTGLEYSQIRSFVNTFDNVTILKPKMQFAEVIKKYGYPLISKEVSKTAQSAVTAKKRGNTTPSLLKMQGKWNDPSGNISRYNQKKWMPLLDVDFRLSSRCCDMMKKSPCKKFEMKTGKKPITAQMACESKLREDMWLHYGCNAFDNKRPVSNPMSFWTEQDVLRYIYENRINICSVYGDVVCDDAQLNFDGEWVTKYHTTGCTRTGCVFCGFGAHLPEDPPRFLMLKQIDPKKYNYCFSGGEFIDGVWQPNKNGLGMQYVYEKLNELYGNGFVIYK